MSKSKQFSRKQVEKIYAQYIKEWVTTTSGDVAIMTDNSEVFLSSQEILSSRGWHPLTPKNIQQHQARIENNLSRKHQGFSREELLAQLAENGYNITVL
ncbi:hypothetical protein [Pleurocapsa sp. PCC 7319]|uniref:hypothetical protein n=1 Tax=Pleurocapsa sp. PCC 7319 TaxID=118161 RepID=UPI0003496319|nr:hypothetical protein [Pleurocapsa sp. PCC 7319]